MSGKKLLIVLAMFVGVVTLGLTGCSKPADQGTEPVATETPVDTAATPATETATPTETAPVETPTETAPVTTPEAAAPATTTTTTTGTL